VDAGLLEISGSPKQGEDKYVSLATLKFIGGLQTQRSPFVSIDTRYNARFLGGKPDALLDGSNCEISNKLLLQRRPGLLAYGTASIPPPIAFYEWQSVAPSNLSLVVDTVPALYNYSPTAAGIYYLKGPKAGQSHVMDLINTLYIGDGFDLVKITGQNLLTQSNTFSNAAWVKTNAVLTGSQIDPLGGGTATKVVFSVASSASLVGQDVTPNYTPVSSNTFTWSIWMKSDSGAPTISLSVLDQANNVIASPTLTISTTWTRYQVTFTMLNTSTMVNVLINGPNSTSIGYIIYGPQLEIGGPASPTVITTNKPFGVYLWGIQAPAAAPTFTFSAPAIAQWQPNTSYSLNQTIIDSNGNIETVTTAGTSGAGQPTWNTVVGGTTVDGQSNQIVQTAFGNNPTTSASATFQNNTVAGHAIVVFVGVMFPTNNTAVTVSDTQSNTYVKADVFATGHLAVYMYYVLSGAGGADVVTVSGGGSRLTWVGIAEVNGLTAIDVHASNGFTNNTSGFFNSGQVTTTNAQDILISYGGFENNQGPGFEIPNLPDNFVSILGQNGLTSQGDGFTNYEIFSAALQYLSATETTNPLWTITNPGKVGNGFATHVAGVTAAFKSSVGSLVWTNGGQTVATGLSPQTGYTYYYSFVNTQTGHRSNVSPISAATGKFVGQNVIVTGTGMQILPSGLWGQDPQVDAIEVYRNTDGGPFYFQIPPSLMGGSPTTITVNGVVYLANPGTTSVAGTWTFTDSVPDSLLNTQIYAPIGFLNSIPPAGLKNLEFFAGRLWGAVNNFLYFNTGTDNAAILNSLQNGVPAESWLPTNFIPFPTPIVRTLAMGAGLIVFTTSDIWMVVGQDITNFEPVKILSKHGLRSYNAVSIDGSTAWIYTADRQALLMNPSGASVEIGFPIGNVLEQTYDPSLVYLARHVSGSRDNAFYIADGSTGWYRLNPNQTGASVSGEPTPVWSPKANITGGIGAIASIEVQPGITKLLCGQTTTGPVLMRDLNTFSDNGTPYSWFASIGSILLTAPGELAETESVTTEMIAADSTQVAVGVLLDEISGSFESLPLSVNDPPQLAPSVSVLSNRFYLSQGATPPICRHMQIQLTGQTVATRDEVLALTVRGARVPEQIAT
jgi:hypothetical protein